MNRSRQFVMVVASLLASVTARADIPHLISFQGNLSDTAGGPLIMSTVTVTFRIYSVAAGGAALWTELDVVTTGSSGAFRVDLGSSTPLPSTLFTDSLRWLGIQVESDPEMIPRVRLVSVPYSYVSESTQDSAAGGWVDVGTRLELATASDSVEVGTTADLGKFGVGILEASTGTVIGSYTTAANSSTGNASAVQGLATGLGSGSALGGEFFTSAAGCGVVRV